MWRLFQHSAAPRRTQKLVTALLWWAGGRGFRMYGCRESLRMNQVHLHLHSHVGKSKPLANCPGTFDQPSLRLTSELNVGSTPSRLNSRPHTQYIWNIIYPRPQQSTQKHGIRLRACEASATEDGSICLPIGRPRHVSGIHYGG